VSEVADEEGLTADELVGVVDTIAEEAEVATEKKKN